MYMNSYMMRTIIVIIFVKLKTIKKDTSCDVSFFLLPYQMMQILSFGCTSAAVRSRFLIVLCHDFGVSFAADNFHYKVVRRKHTACKHFEYPWACTAYKCHTGFVLCNRLLCVAACHIPEDNLWQGVSVSCKLLLCPLEICHLLPHSSPYRNQRQGYL